MLGLGNYEGLGQAQLEAKRSVKMRVIAISVTKIESEAQPICV